MILERPQNVENSTAQNLTLVIRLSLSLVGNGITVHQLNTPRLRSGTTGVVTDILTGPGHS
jgi:hypothetical protein